VSTNAVRERGSAKRRKLHGGVLPGAAALGRIDGFIRLLPTPTESR
jgi:hypothetical protein